ncbi:MAG TPA: hypothetical protein VHA37_04460 [Candidatus Saccharimonadales bacterium]|nr:hypothetical protein [Candidatus Saccharimonadales bacterium]
MLVIFTVGCLAYTPIFLLELWSEPDGVAWWILLLYAPFQVLNARNLFKLCRSVFHLSNARRNVAALAVARSAIALEHHMGQALAALEATKL